jgi:ORF6N domain
MKSDPPLGTLILTIRSQKVLLDADLAAIYGVPTKALNQAVKRNADRFPNDFLFQLTDEEKQEVVTNCDHLARLKFSKTLPYAFTEHGALMAANVLNSPEAVKMSVYVVRSFIKQRELLMAQSDVLKKLTQMDAKLLKQDDALRLIWRELQPLLSPPPSPPKRQIGFHQK